MVQHHCDLRAIAWAHRITQQFGLSPPVDVKIALAGCGLNIYRVDGLRRNVSFLAYDPQVDTFAVFASPQYDPAHLRVALAHHLGCYILHHHLIQDGREHPCEKNAEPWPDVSVFAGELLLPGDKLRAACKKRQQAFHSGRLAMREQGHRADVPGSPYLLAPSATATWL